MIRLLLALIGSTLAYGERAVPRVVIGLWDSTVSESTERTVIHRMAELPLNHLGFVVDYVDVNGPLPDLSQRGEVRGIVSWLPEDRMRDPTGYVAWIERSAALGKRFVLIGDAGISFDRKGNKMPDSLLHRLRRVLGVAQSGDWSQITYDTKITEKSEIIGFERPLGPVLPPFEMMRAVVPGAKVHLTVRRNGDSQLVATTPRGGWIASGYSHYSDSAHNVQWLVDPFVFFRLALAAGDLPTPDTTTLYGRRIYYSHVDGDGWLNLAEIPEYRKQRANAAEVFLREIVDGYPDLPVTLGPVVAEIDPGWVGTPASREQARKILERPWVEVGTHTYTHPLDWGFFARYDRNAEKKYSNIEAAAGSESPYAVPRSYTDRPFDIKHEVHGSIAYIQALLPKGKRVEVLQWSGNTEPFPNAISEARRAGVRNINGGDSRFDGEFPSVAWVSPIGILRGDERQIYSSNSNENTYTDLWTRRHFAFQYLQRTVTATDGARRLKPFNVYYHLYSCEKSPGLRAVKQNLDLARRSAIVPITTSQYAAVGDGFYSTRLIELGPRRWRVENRDGLGTLRFDLAGELAVDFAKSSGVIGMQRHGSDVYVALDPAEPYPIVSMMAGSGFPAASIPYVIESRWRIWRLRHATGGWDAVLQGFGVAEMVWRMPRAGRYRFAIGGGKAVDIATGPDGIAQFRLDESAVSARPLRITEIAGGAS
ncbi:MAG: hypothetical protein FJW38_26690 [Acidobacteria bacterium]|nr:hypothetical protein [Acidobacteriota bacterium]